MLSGAEGSAMDRSKAIRLLPGKSVLFRGQRHSIMSVKSGLQSFSANPAAPWRRRTPLALQFNGRPAVQFGFKRSTLPDCQGFSFSHSKRQESMRRFKHCGDLKNGSSLRERLAKDLRLPESINEPPCAQETWKHRPRYWTASPRGKGSTLFAV
jgi:hypothetical protein